MQVTKSSTAWLFKIVCVLVSAFAISCSNGGTPTPTHLLYPQSTITGIVGQAITPDTPTVTGTVTYYSIYPVLPLGLTLDRTTGTISGTPTVAAMATYTAFAVNSAGSTTANIQITINVVAPTNLVFPTTAITATVGRMIAPDIPAVAGTVTSYTVSPALPAGLTLDSTTGMISGTPTAPTATAVYTVTAANSGGSVVATVRITVVQRLTSLLDLGHDTLVWQLAVQTSRVLSRDGNGHWVLWDYSSGEIVAEGDQGGGVLQNSQGQPVPDEMVGPTIVIAVPNGLEVRSSSDGHILSTIVAPGLNTPNPPVSNVSWWQLASDGSYVCAGMQAGLFVWAPTGELLLFRPGDYSTAGAFAAPTEVRIGLGPAGQNIVETVSIPSGTSTISPPFSGQFNSWFLDGERFFTNTSTTVFIYSKTGVQQSVIELPTVNGLAGEGTWFWTQGGFPSYPLVIYSVGGSSPVVTYDTNDSEAKFIPSGTTIGILSSEMSVVDLSGSMPVKTDYNVPIGLFAYGAVSSSQWLVANEAGAVLDGSHLSNGPRYFGYGLASSIAGATGRVAISTASGIVLYFDPALTTPEGSISFSSGSNGEVALSSDGTVMGASGNSYVGWFAPYETLNIYSLPSGALTNSFIFTYQNGNVGGSELFGFTLSSSGDLVGQVVGVWDGSKWNYVRQVVPSAGGAAIWSDMGQSPNDVVLISPDETTIAASSANPWPSSNSVTNIYKNGVLVTAVPGFAAGWIDNGRILVNHYVSNGMGYQYQGATIYSPSGTVVATPNLPELPAIQVVTSDLVYSPTENAIFSLSTGQTIWMGPYPSQEVGAVSGPYVVFEAQDHVLVDSY